MSPRKVLKQWVLIYLINYKKVIGSHSRCTFSCFHRERNPIWGKSINCEKKVRECSDLLQHWLKRFVYQYYFLFCTNSLWCRTMNSALLVIFTVALVGKGKGDISWGDPSKVDLQPSPQKSKTSKHQQFVSRHILDTINNINDYNKWRRW